MNKFLLFASAFVRLFCPMFPPGKKRGDIPNICGLCPEKIIVIFNRKLIYATRRLSII